MTNDVGQTIYYDRDTDTRAVARADGSIEVTRHGHRLVMNEEQITLNVQNIRSVSIKNILRLASYKLIEDGNEAAHEITFRNGDSCVLSYDRTGRLKKFGGRCSITLSDEGDITIAERE